ncbi:unnamed protein product [Porites lobata]|uniref:Uncharacterized protein n=1 Tax=Porites lobata TaxID=104759 RepID=A0ABN8NST4_9CNID|nr:unnamed protein product [Porites lobata]
MEEAYRSSLFKSFTKTLEDGFFPVVIVDAIHDKVEHFEKYWSHAKQKGFEVRILKDDIGLGGDSSSSSKT